MDGYDEFDVVRNAAGEYSLWPTAKAMPAGWESVGIRGEKVLCLEWIEENWVDAVGKPSLA